MLNADYDGDGSLDTGLSLAIVNPNTGVPIKRYVIEIHRDSAASPGTYTLWKRDTVEAEDVADTLTTTYAFKANKNRLHKARVKAVAFGGKKGAFSSLTAGVQPDLPALTLANPTALSVLPSVLNVRLGWPRPTTPTYAYTEIWQATNSTSFGSATLMDAVHGSAYHDFDADVSTNTYSYWIIHVDKFGNRTNRYPTGSSGGVRPLNVSTSQIQDNSIRERYGSVTNTSQTIPSGVTTTIEAVSSVFHGSDCDTADVFFDFRNNSGAGKTFTVTIEDGSGNVYYTFPNVFLADDGHFGSAVTIATFSGTSTTYRLRVNATAAATVNNTKLQIVLGKR